MKNKPSHESNYADDLSSNRVLPATIGGPISPRTVFSQMIEGEVRSGRYSRLAHRKLLKLAKELGLRRADAEDIIFRCCQEYADSPRYQQLADPRSDSGIDPVFGRILGRAFSILALAALIECLVIYWRS